MKPKIVALTGRKGNKLALETARKALKLLEGKVRVETDKGFLGKGKPLGKIRAGLVLSFGGDGTLLKTFRELKARAPVMEINCGNKGFLSAYQHNEIGKAVEAALKGNFSVEERSRVSAKIDGKIKGAALNEVLIVPKAAGRMLKCSLRVGGEERIEAGDGLIIATPTGSTAHSLSAGGPVVKGNAKVFVVVSVNPVDWKHRPLIVNDHEKIIVSGFGKSGAIVVVDGQERFAVKKKIELIKGASVLLARKKGLK
ncbi:MAG TPA: NAD(+)/NADH kinase [archaeon]|nr:NAD(+)/NADH kinase [archaeon]